MTSLWVRTRRPSSKTAQRISKSPILMTPSRIAFGKDSQAQQGVFAHLDDAFADRLRQRLPAGLVSSHSGLSRDLASLFRTQLVSSRNPSLGSARYFFPIFWLFAHCKHLANYVLALLLRRGWIASRLLNSACNY